MLEFMESFHFILAMKIWERHELLEVTVGYFSEELISYETATTLVMVVAFLFPVLSLLEIILYLTYQKRVWSLLISNFTKLICFPFPFSSIHGVKLSRATLAVDVNVHIVAPVPHNVCQSQTVAERQKKMRWWKK